MHFSKDVSPDDGRLDGFFLSDQPRWKVLWRFFQGRGGRRPFPNKDTVAVHSARIRVRASGHLYPQADGERASSGGVSEIEFKALPGALTLLAAQ